jgi:hypothetical protein
VKYRYIIWDSFDGSFKGTNDTQVAEEYSEANDFSVYDSERGMWLSDHEEYDIAPLENVDD